MGKLGEIIFVAMIIVSCGIKVKPDESDHRYKAGDLVPLYANKVGPFNNPSETYRYYDFPFCRPDYMNEKKEALYEVLNGDRLANAPYKLEFLIDRHLDEVCERNLTMEEVSKFRDAIAEDYYLQMYCDDMPIWSFIGKIDGERKKYFLFNHLHFRIYYNGEHIIEVQALIDPSDVVELRVEKALSVNFKYTVTWKETHMTFEERMGKYFGYFSLSDTWKMHRFSITNSCLTILLLIGCLLTYYLQVLQKDFESSFNEGLGDNQEETGWKNIHSDVFRYPNHKSLLAAALGSGAQLFTLTIVVLILGIVGAFYPYKRGDLLTALVIIFAITSGVAGYTSTSFYGQLGGTGWVRNMLLSGLLFCGPLFVAFCFLNTVASSYHATAALPFGTIFIIFLIWTLVALPLLLLGGIAGKNCKSEFQAPCHTSMCPREIPPLPWYRTSLPQVALAGILPFGVMCNELYYIFISVWGHRIYFTYGTLFLVSTILLIATGLVAVALTQFQFAAEDHRWWWRSFLYGGSVGFYVYGYCFYYYYFRSDFSGFLQTSFYFGYMACICFGIFLMLGTVGFYASLLFVSHIYSSIKCD